MISTPRIPIMRYFNTGADPYLQRSVLAHPQQYVPYFFRELPRFASKPKNELGFTDFWSLNHQDWIAANFPHCKKCCNPHHPGYPATPAFLDCKHGHYLSRDRIEQQMEWERIRNFWGRICMAAAFVYIVRGTAGAILIFYEGYS